MSDDATSVVRQHDSAALAAVAALEPEAAALGAWARVLHDVATHGGRVLAAGNGGSAAHAQHLTSELVGRFCRDRRAFDAICLSAETSAVTAIANDYGFDEVFSRQVEAHGRPGDLLVLFSTSGRSANLLRAAGQARRRGVRTLALTGPAPNPLSTACAGAITVDAPTMAAVQDAHQVVIHALCAAFDHLHLDPPSTDREEAMCAPSSS
jgi:type III pantothenate kinase